MLSGKKHFDNLLVHVDLLTAQGEKKKRKWVKKNPISLIFLKYLDSVADTRIMCACEILVAVVS